jgi:hypothetical protein
MNTAKVVEREMQRDGGFQMRQLFAERMVSRVNLRSCIRIVRFCRST